MKAVLLLDERHVLAETAFVEIRIWRVPKPVAGSAHAFKYSLALVCAGVCVLRYDNEAGKGDHKHVGDRQVDYAITAIEDLIDDFWTDVGAWRDA